MSSKKRIEIEAEADYLASLKSLETENWVDRVFYRPIGYKLARWLAPTGVHPNFITFVSIIVGVTGAALFYFSEPCWVVLVAIALMIFANILDCVDGQLARLTGVKSKLGRILDGVAGYLWFLALYLAISFRLFHQHGEWIFFLLAPLSMLSHALQAGVTDYYKTLHLRFISAKTGQEFESYEQIKARIQSMSPGIEKLFFQLYRGYSWVQSCLTPNLQKMLSLLGRQGASEEERRHFRKVSKIVMKSVDLLTFNGRTIPLFLIALTGRFELYFLYEIIFLNIVLVLSIAQHEELCRWTIERISQQKSHDAEA